MTIVYDLSEAVPAALLGMFALWAAASKRHWFVRTGVVGAAILVVLLIPAYEVVVQFSIECLLIIAGLAWWRRRRNPATNRPAKWLKPWQLRLSLETLLLAVVLIAVPTAVITKAHGFANFDWYDLILCGIITGGTALACVWIVFGRSPLWVRIFAIPIFALVIAVAQTGLFWIGAIFRHWWYVVKSDPLADYIKLALRQFWPDVKGWIWSTGIGIAIVTVWLVLMRRAEWLDPFDDLSSHPAIGEAENRRGVVLTRSAACMWFGIIALFPLFILVSLLQRTPIPTVQLPQPNGFDDFVAAGKMIGPTAAKKLRAFDLLSPQALVTEVAGVLPALQLVQDGLKKDCWNPHGYKPFEWQDWAALGYITDAYCGQAALARQNGDEQVLLEEDLAYLRLSIAVGRGLPADGIINDVFYRYEPDVANSLWDLSAHLSLVRIREIVVELSELDSRREPWEVLAERERIFEENATWQRHLNWLLRKWSGQDRSAMSRQQYLRRVTQLRVLILKLAARAYEKEKGHPPAVPADLIPDYLPSIPGDPFDGGQLKYCVIGNSYTLYSVGRNGIDDGGSDGGTTVIEPYLTRQGDLTESQMFPARTPE